MQNNYSIQNDVLPIFPLILKFSSNLYTRQDKRRYGAGDRALIWAYSAVPTLKEIGLHLEAKVNGEKNVALRYEEGRWKIVTPRLMAGVHILSLQLYRQDARLAKTVEVAAEAFRKEIFEIDDKLAVETDPAVVGELIRRKSYLYQEIDRLEVALVKTRVPFGANFSQDIIYE